MKILGTEVSSDGRQLVAQEFFTPFYIVVKIHFLHTVVLRFSFDKTPSKCEIWRIWH